KKIPPASVNRKKKRMKYPYMKTKNPRKHVDFIGFFDFYEIQ
ncbi:hypothetical protein YPPY52_2402, partial [Yersinia pestis PY-52]